MTKHLSLRFTLFLILADLLLVCVALLFSTVARIYIPLGMSGKIFVWILPLPIYLMGLVIFGISFNIVGVYNPRHSVRLSTELQNVGGAILVAWLVFIGALYLTYRDVSRLQIIYFLVFYTGLVFALRIALRQVFRSREGVRYNIRKVLIIGTEEPARNAAEMINTYAWAGLKVVGFIDTHPAEYATAPPNPVPVTPIMPPVLGTLSDLAPLIAQETISEVVIAVERDPDFDLRELVSFLEAQDVNIRLVPNYFDMAFLRVHVEDFSGIPLLTLKEPALSPYQRLIKRIFDLVVTSILLIPMLPFMGIIALLIKLDDHGPVFFRQPRIGEGGKTFDMFKFRTMYDGADRDIKMVITYDEDGNLIHKRPNDPRVTRVGRFLRRTSLDELPQFFNIMRGDMSLVGPRPELPALVDKYEPWQRKRFEVPQGLTGWWQVNGRSDKPMHLNTEADLFYVRNYSLWLDIKIVIRTVGVVLSARGAF